MVVRLLLWVFWSRLFVLRRVILVFFLLRFWVRGVLCGRLVDG